MSILDFKEIPKAYKATGQQDMFELFARDFLVFLGFKVISPPNRGADGKVDLIVTETRKGALVETVVQWLVSCKHKVFSRKSVTPDDEPDILDRIKSKGCNGFIGFYSTLPSSGLSQKLDQLVQQENIEREIFDAARIENYLLGSPEGYVLAQRYFPISSTTWRRNNPSPVQLFVDNDGLRCENCGADLMSKKQREAVVTFWRKMSDPASEEYIRHVQDIYWCCKGDCDMQLKDEYRRKNPDWADQWAFISDLCIPHRYLQLTLSTIRSLHEGRSTYTDAAFEKQITLLFELFPFVTRELSDEEKEQLQVLKSIPSWAGGMGF